MARLWTAGAESGAVLSERLTISGAVTCATTQHRAPGARGFRTVGSATAAFGWIAWTGTATHHYYSRHHVYLTAVMTNNNVPFINWQTSTPGDIIQLRINNDRTVDVFNAITAATLATGIFTLPTGEWHRVETHLLTNASTGVFEVLYGGVSVYSASNLNTGSTAPSRLNMGSCTAAGGGGELWFDDCGLNNNQTGGAQTSWLGDGYVLDLLPTADSSRGNWTGGAGGTTSLFAAIDNEPPVGVAAASGTNTSQVKDTVAAASPGDFTMQTYTAAGVGAGDTVVLTQIEAIVASESASSTTASLQGVSNPTLALTAILSGAYGGATMGTFPTGWKWADNGTVPFPFIVYAPSVTLGTAPVVRLQRVSVTSGRNPHCCYLALRVEAFTPPPTRTIPCSIVANSPDKTRTVTASLVAASSNPTFRAAANAASLTCNKPTGTQEGDILIAYVNDEGNHTLTPPDGSWSTIINQQNSSSALRFAAFWKLAGASEPSTYTWTITGATYTEIDIAAFYNVDPTTPVNTSNYNSATGSNNPSAIPNITTTVAHCIISLMLNDWNGLDWTTHIPSTYTVDTGETLGGTWDVVSCHKDAATATTYGGENPNFQSGVTPHIVTVIALQPVVAGGPTPRTVSTSLVVSDPDQTRTVPASAVAWTPNLARTVSTSLVAANTLTRTVTSSAVALATATRPVSASAVTLKTSTRTVTASVVAYTPNLTRTITASTVALLTSMRTVTASLVASGSVAPRTVPASLVANSPNLARTVTASAVAALLGLTRTVSASAVATTPNVTRTITTSAVALKTSIRTVSASLVASGAPVRSVSASVVALATSARTVTAGVVAQTPNVTRTVPASLAAALVKTRTVSSSLAALQTKTRTVASGAVAQQTVARTVGAEVTVLAQLARSVLLSLVCYVPGAPNTNPPPVGVGSGNADPLGVSSGGGGPVASGSSGNPIGG